MKAILSLLAATIAAVSLAATATAKEAPGVTSQQGTQSEGYVPGVTDFPRVEQKERYIPGVTDVPSRAAEIRVPAPVSAVPVSDGFDWLDAGFGVGLGLALGALAAASLLALRRRTGLSTA